MGLNWALAGSQGITYLASEAVFLDMTGATSGCVNSRGTRTRLPSKWKTGLFVCNSL